MSPQPSTGPRTAAGKAASSKNSLRHGLASGAIRLQNEALATAAPGTLPPSFALLLRYQTTNEPAFYRAHKALEDSRKAAQQFVSQTTENARQTRESEALAFLTRPFPPLDIGKHLERVRVEREQKAAAANSCDPK